MARVVVVLGATGVQGGSVVRALSLAGGFDVRAVTRSPTSASAKALGELTGVTLVRADLSDIQTIERAIEGAEAVFAVTNPYDSAMQGADDLEEARQGCRLADVAKRQGVELFIWSMVPSALVRSGAQSKSPPLVENKSIVSQYLKARDIRHLDLSMGMYMDNWINQFSISRPTTNGALELEIPILTPNQPQGLVWVEKDLGRYVLAILQAYRTKPYLLGKPMYFVSGHWSQSDFMKEIKKQTGIDVYLKTGPSTGFEQLDMMMHAYNAFGVHGDLELPHPRNVDLGVELSKLSDFVREAYVPFLQKRGLISTLAS